MKGPSLDAIRKFKEQQERKKRQEDEKKIKEKLSTLEHRAAQGDRKAKIELKRIEKLKDEKTKEPEPQVVVSRTQSQPPSASGIKQPERSKAKVQKKKVETDFDELMRLAKQNKNEIKRPQQPPEKPITVNSQQPPQSHRQNRPMPINSHQIKAKPTTNNNQKPKLSTPQQSGSAHGAVKSTAREFVKTPRQEAAIRHRTVVCRPGHQADRRPNYGQSYRRNHYDDDDDDEYEDEDDYESDGFVVDEDDEDIQDEVRRTIRSVFRYDKRRCDTREEELDRQYRAIGRVSTFEDLEREERRASRLAAAEDAEAQREEDERKRKKKIRLGKS